MTKEAWVSKSHPIPCACIKQNWSQDKRVSLIKTKTVALNAESIRASIFALSRAVDKQDFLALPFRCRKGFASSPAAFEALSLTLNLTFYFKGAEGHYVSKMP